MDLRLLKQACCLIKQARNITQMEWSTSPQTGTAGGVMKYYGNPNMAAEIISTNWSVPRDDAYAAAMADYNVRGMKKELDKPEEEQFQRYYNYQLDEYDRAFEDALNNLGKYEPEIEPEPEDPSISKPNPANATPQFGTDPQGIQLPKFPQYDQVRKGFNEEMRKLRESYNYEKKDRDNIANKYNLNFDQ